MQSLSEIDTTSKRASKAAGFSWGVAEEIGKAIRNLELFGLPDKEMETVVSKLYDEVMLRYGACDKLHSDKGGEFVNKLMQELCKRWGIEKTNTSGYAPWSNGQVERSNASLKIMLRMFGEHYRHSWDKHLQR